MQSSSITSLFDSKQRTANMALAQRRADTANLNILSLLFFIFRLTVLQLKFYFKCHLRLLNYISAGRTQQQIPLLRQCPSLERHQSNSMRLAIILLSSFFYNITVAQNCSTIKNGKVKVGIINKTKTNSSGFIGKITHSYTSLMFFTGFKDSIVAYLNDSSIYKGYLKSEFSSGITKISIPLNFTNVKKDNILRIEVMNKNECMIANLKTQYKAIHIHKGNTWHINYTNYRILVE